MKEKPWYEGVNNGEDVKNAGPEAVRFHGTYKSLMRMLLPKIKTPQHWLDEMTGNFAVLRDIYYEYLEYEKQTQRPGEINLRAQQDRKTIISSAVPFILTISHYDPNYTEVAEWFIYRICQEYEAGKFYFNPYHCLPESWYQDEKGRCPPPAERAMEFMNKYYKPPK